MHVSPDLKKSLALRVWVTQRATAAPPRRRGDAATWGMEAWARGELVLGTHDASPEAAPAALGHLVLEPVPDLDALEGRLAPAFVA